MSQSLTGAYKAVTSQDNFHVMHIYAYRGAKDGFDPYIAVPPGFPIPSRYEHLGTIHKCGYIALKIPTRFIESGQPCWHTGCKAHISHPCEKCGRTGCNGIALLDMTGVLPEKYR